MRMPWGAPEVKEASALPIVFADSSKVTVPALPKAFTINANPDSMESWGEPAGP